jgi:hypothetical protein
MFVKLAFLADFVTFDLQRKLIAVGVFDVILAPKFPARHPELSLVANLEGTINEQGDHKLSIEFRGDKGNKLSSFEQKISLTSPGVTKGSRQAGVLTKIRDLDFPKTGQYEFVLFVDDRFLCRIPFAVRQITQAAEG